MRGLSGVAAMVRLGVQTALHFRTNVVISVVGVSLQTILFVTVWRNVYGERQSVQGVEVERAVGYAILAVAVTHLALPFRLSSLPDRVRIGAIATDVIRPLGIVGQNLAHSVGESVAALPGVASVILLGWTLGGLRAAASTEAMGLFIPSVMLGLLMTWILNLTVATVAFWTTDTRGTLYIYRTVTTFCSGAIVPLWFLPAPIGDVIQVLPFKFLVFVPLEIWFGQATVSQSAVLLAQQCGWLVVLLGLLFGVSRRALRVVVINGG